ncbi:MAG: hemerythrin family protein [Proteobacteria bacterium]|nr:hemerythrin family protein [Pseudomonadota bacterium]
MALIEWSDKDFSVGVPDIDEQHREWIGIINRLHDALLSPEAGDYKYTLFKELLAYTDLHFSDEERLMEDIDYPHLQKHKEMHYFFKTQILEQVQMLFKGEPIMMSQVMSQLKHWLTEHIMKEDMKFGKYISHR